MSPGSTSPQGSADYMSSPPFDYNYVSYPGHNSAYQYQGAPASPSGSGEASAATTTNTATSSSTPATKERHDKHEGEIIPAKYEPSAVGEKASGGDARPNTSNGVSVEEVST